MICLLWGQRCKYRGAGQCSYRVPRAAHIGARTVSEYDHGINPWNAHSFNLYRRSHKQGIKLLTKACRIWRAPHTVPYAGKIHIKNVNINTYRKKKETYPISRAAQPPGGMRFQTVPECNSRRVLVRVCAGPRRASVARRSLLSWKATRTFQRPCRARQCIAGPHVRK